MCKTSGTPLKDHTYVNHGHIRRRCIGIENIINKVIAENFLNLEKEMVSQIQEGFRISKI
jgi:hypothetical protein